MSDEHKCEWERCVEPAPNRARWRREAADGHRDAFDHAYYCDGHMMMAASNGAVCIEREPVKEPISSIPPNPTPLWRRALAARGQKV
jgi:hypothetical protein